MLFAFTFNATEMHKLLRDSVRIECASFDSIGHSLCVASIAPFERSHSIETAQNAVGIRIPIRGGWRSSVPFLCDSAKLKKSTNDQC